MEGMEVGHVLLFFSFQYHQHNFSCTLINWFVHDDEPDHDTGMWTVQIELVLQLHYVCTMYTMIYTVTIYNIMYKSRYMVYMEPLM